MSIDANSRIPTQIMATVSTTCSQVPLIGNSATQTLPIKILSAYSLNPSVPNSLSEATPLFTFCPPISEASSHDSTINLLEPFYDTMLYASSGLTRRKRGRPRKTVHTLKSSDMNGNEEFVSDTLNVPYHPDRIWCPLCLKTYTSPFCPSHPFFDQPDSPNITYARRSLPECLVLKEKHNKTRVFTNRRLQVMTRFGPVVAPSVSAAHLHANPDLLVSFD